MSERRTIEPSALAPNASVGELVTEIDRARHDAAHTVNELTRRFDPRSRVPDNVTRYTRTTVQYVKRVPVQVWVIAAVVLLWSRRRRGR